jgi:hypothetical protein
MTLELEQKQPILDIVNALLVLLPNDWTSAELSIERKVYDGGVEGCAHLITGPSGSREFVEPSDDLYQKTWSLAMLFQRHGRPWQHARLRVQLTSEADWEYTIEFGYR